MTARLYVRNQRILTASRPGVGAGFELACHCECPPCPTTHPGEFRSFLALPTRTGTGTVTADDLQVQNGSQTVFGSLNQQAATWSRFRFEFTFAGTYFDATEPLYGRMEYKAEMIHAQYPLADLVVQFQWVKSAFGSQNISPTVRFGRNAASSQLIKPTVGDRVIAEMDRLSDADVRERYWIAGAMKFERAILTQTPDTLCNVACVYWVNHFYPDLDSMTWLSDPVMEILP